MRIIFLGTGPSTRYKRPGRSNRSRSSILVEENDLNILVDCSPDFLEQVEKNKIEKIDSLIITHGHSDAISGIPDLVEYLKKKNIDSIPTYAEETTWKQIYKRFKKTDRLDKFIFLPYEQFTVGETVKIVPFRVIHPVVQKEKFLTVGFYFPNEKVVYAEDFDSLPDNSIDFFKKKKIIIADAAGWRRKFFGHRAFISDLPFYLNADNDLVVGIQMGIEVPTHEKAEKELKSEVKKLGGDPDKFMLSYDGLKLNTQDIKQIVSPDIPWIVPTTPGHTGPTAIEEEKQITSEDVPGLTAPITPEGTTGLEYPKLKAIVVDDIVAEYFADRKIKAFVKDKLGEVTGDVYVCGTGGKVYGIVKLNRPSKMSRERVLQLTETHGLDQSYIDAKWPDLKFLYFYTFKIVKVFKQPKEYEKPPATMDFLQEVNFKNLVEKMRLEDITPETLSKVGNPELVSLHHRVHQLFGLWQQQGKAVELLVNLHTFIVEEFEKRNLNHNVHDKLDKLTEKLRRQRKYLIEYSDIKDIRLIEDYVSLVGSTVECQKEPDDVDVLFKRLDRDKLEKAVSENLKTEVHGIHGAKFSHGLSLPLYDLVLQRKEKLEYKEPLNLVKVFNFMQSKKLINFTVEEFLNEYKDSASSVLLEPCFKGKKLQVHKSNNNIRIYNILGQYINNEQLIKAFEKIEFPEICIVDGILLGNGVFVLTDILLKNTAQFLYEPLANRKIFLSKLNIDEISIIKKVKHFRCFNSIELVKSLDKFKENRWDSVIARFASSKYCTAPYKISLNDNIKNFSKKIEPFDKIDPMKPGKKYTTLEFEGIDDCWKYWAQGYIDDGIFVEEKLDGLRCIAQKKGTDVLIYFEEAKSDRSKLMPHLVEELKKINGDVIVDGELLEYKNRTKIPRRDMIGWATGKEPLDDSGLVLMAFDIVYANEDVSKKILMDRKKILEDKVKDGKHIRKVDYTSVKDKDHFYNAVKKVSNLPDSEGAVVKSANSTYEPGTDAVTWAKIKNLKELHVLVLKQNITRAKTYNYECGIGPITEKDLEKYSNIESFSGKNWIHIGRTYNTSLKVNAGQTLSVTVAEVVKKEEDGKIKYTWDNPVVRNLETVNKPFTVEEVDKVSGLGRAKNLEMEKAEGPIGPYFIVPQDKKKRDFVVHFHYRGLSEQGQIKRGDSLHEDLRLDTGEGFLVGWTLFDPGSSTGNINGDIRKSKFLQGGKKQVQVTTKLSQPRSWLKVEGDSAPGEVGATSKQWAKFVIVANGKFLFGSQRKEDKKNKVTELHEYFLYPSKGPNTIEGRWIVVKLELPPRNKEQKDIILKTGDEDLVLMEEEYEKIYKNAFTIKEWIKLKEHQIGIINNMLNQVENQEAKLPDFAINNLKCDKIQFEEEVEYYQKTIKQEEGKEPEEPTKVTYLMWKPKQQQSYASQEKNREWAEAHPENYQI